MELILQFVNFTYFLLTLVGFFLKLNVIIFILLFINVYVQEIFCIEKLEALHYDNIQIKF